MDLASLEIFRCVVEEGGITRAATRLHRVQSNVTTRIRQLEASLGVDLFLRDGKRMVLTPAGQTLFDYARRVLDLAEEARQAVLPARPQGRLRIASMESTAASRLPAVLAAYHQAWPDVELELVTYIENKRNEIQSLEQEVESNILRLADMEDELRALDERLGGATAVTILRLLCHPSRCALAAVPAFAQHHVLGIRLPVQAPADRRLGRRKILPVAALC